jgi:hypothetical protein
MIDSAISFLRFEGLIQKKVALLVQMETSRPRKNNLKPFIKCVQPAGNWLDIMYMLKRFDTSVGLPDLSDICSSFLIDWWDMKNGLEG